MTITVKYAILCDDIRQEKSGKFIMIGVYARDIGLIQSPAHLSLSLMVGLEASAPGIQEIYFNGYLNGNLTMKSKGQLNVSVPGPILLPIIGQQFRNITTGGNIEFRWSNSDDDNSTWNSFFSIPIRFVSPAKKTKAPVA